MVSLTARLMVMNKHMSLPWKEKRPIHSIRSMKRLLPHRGDISIKALLSCFAIGIVFAMLLAGIVSLTGFEFYGDLYEKTVVAEGTTNPIINQSDQDNTEQSHTDTPEELYQESKQSATSQSVVIRSNYQKTEQRFTMPESASENPMRRTMQALNALEVE